MAQQSDIVREILLKINNANLIENIQQKLLRLEDITTELYHNQQITNEDISQVLPILNRIGNEIAEQLAEEQNNTSSESSDNEDIDEDNDDN